MAELVIALDVANSNAALQAVRSLAPVPAWYKIGLELFTAEGPSIIRHVLQEEKKVFLDLKFHDIPNTVKGACASACQLGVHMLTLHISGGEAMAHAALQGREQAKSSATSPIMLGVTVLTSDATHKDKATEVVVQRALLAKSYGLDGVVCSGLEAAAVKAACGKNFLCLCPGIRFAGTQRSDDQARVCTPDEAVANGADFLVMGRPILGAENPLLAATKAIQLIKTQ